MAISNKASMGSGRGGSNLVNKRPNNNIHVHASYSRGGYRIFEKGGLQLDSRYEKQCGGGGGGGGSNPLTSPFPSAYAMALRPHHAFIKLSTSLEG